MTTDCLSAQRVVPPMIPESPSPPAPLINPYSPLVSLPFPPPLQQQTTITFSTAQIPTQWKPRAATKKFKLRKHRGPNKQVLPKTQLHEYLWTKIIKNSMREVEKHSSTREKSDAEMEIEPAGCIRGLEKDNMWDAKQETMNDAKLDENLWTKIVENSVREVEKHSSTREKSDAVVEIRPAGCIRGLEKDNMWDTKQVTKNDIMKAAANEARKIPEEMKFVIICSQAAEKCMDEPRITAEARGDDIKDEKVQLIKDDCNNKDGDMSINMCCDEKSSEEERRVQDQETAPDFSAMVDDAMLELFGAVS